MYKTNIIILVLLVFLDNFRFTKKLSLRNIELISVYNVGDFFTANLYCICLSIPQIYT